MTEYAPREPEIMERARPFEDAPAPLARAEASAMDIATTTASQEVQVAFVMAKKFPRDEQEAYRRIMKACSRRSLAEQASYAFPRGGTKVTGPSIRLAEVLAQNWGNFKSGVIELERKRGVGGTGESVAMSYAVDLETNSWDTKVFTVRHWRDTQSGGYALTDERDIYELVANQGARRKRACILSLIPGDIAEAAESECDKTLSGQNAEPLSDRVRAALVDFEKVQVTKEMIETRLGFKVEAMSEQHLAALKKVFVSLRDGMSKRGDWFKPPAADGSKPANLDEMADALASKASKPKGKKTAEQFLTGEPTAAEKAEIEAEDRRAASP